VREALGLPPEPPLVGPQPPPATTPELATDAS
jgi:hypothetical protein